MNINIYVFCEATSCILVAGFSEILVRSYQDTGCYETLRLADESITYPVVLVPFCGYCFVFRKGSASGIKIVFHCPSRHLFLERFCSDKCSAQESTNPGCVRSPG